MADKSEKAETPEEAAFTEHYDRLTGALPIVKLLPKFISKRIITFSEQDKILAGETDSDKTKRFLEHIEKHFNGGNTYVFYKFLEVVELHGGQYAYLATEIKKSIEEHKTQQQTADKEKEKLTQAYQVEEDTDETTKGKWAISRIENWRSYHLGGMSIMILSSVYFSAATGKIIDTTHHVTRI